jgi:hypothetical protein
LHRDRALGRALDRERIIQARPPMTSAESADHLATDAAQGGERVIGQPVIDFIAL